MDRTSFKLSCQLVLFIVIISGSCLDPNSPTPTCLNMAERSKWNRSFHFNNQELRLKLEVTNRSSHWIVNYIFEILARERLGYQSIEFVKQDMDHPKQAISRLDCKDTNCFKLPDVHINLELWLSLGTTPSFWAPHNRVIDNGPLGPINRWAISSREEFILHLSSLMKAQSKLNCRSKYGSTNPHYPSSQTEVQSECDLDICRASEFRNEFIRYFTGSKVSSRQSSRFPNLHSSSSVMSIINWYPPGFGASPLPSGLHFFAKQNQLNSTALKIVLEKTYNCGQVDLSASSYLHNPKKSFCRFESQQATKLSWAKLKNTVPLIYQLVDRMHFSQSEYENLLNSANHLNPSSKQDLQSQYRDIACKWLRLSPARWASWTEGWDKKLNLTVAGLFAFYGKWVVSNLDHVAEQAINFVNNNPDYFSNTEYALTLDVHNLTCSQDVVLNDYFDLLTASKSRKIIGVIAALCSDSIEPVVEVANMRRQIVVSPTVESVRFAKRHQYPYFFRTVPSMTHVSLILIRLFSNWGWRRVAVFRENDHFFDPLVFQSNGIDLIADFVMKENQLTYVTVHQALKLMNDRTSRIFMVEYFAKGTAIILCAAYHLGMHFDAGYVWFLNPWLSSNWWHAADVHPLECTYDEMHNITSWTFTVGHQLIMEPLVHRFMPSSFNDMSLFAFDSSFHNRHGIGRRVRRYSNQFAQDSRIRKFKHPLFNGQFTNNYDDSPSDSESQRSVFSTKSEDVGYVHSSHDYAIHTYESVIVLAAALIHLLHQNPSAISVFESLSVAEAYRELVFETDFRYTISSRFIMDDSFKNPVISLDTGFHYVYRKDEVKSASQLRFNNLNERVADYWLLKQHQINTTVPIVLWTLDQELISDDSSVPLTSLVDASDLTTLAASEHFAHLMGERWINDVNWGSNNGPPDDGSERDDDCVFGFVSRVFGVNCTGSTVIATISMVFSMAILCLILFIVYYRRKLEQTHLRIRQPYENLCNELKDIDIPSADIVLNRRVGQGAFGMVYGGEAKRNGRWEAVAVKVIGSKATYEGKTDFLSEAKLMRSLDHQNVVRLVGICLYPKENHLYLIMEFMLNGDLKTYLLSRRVLAQQVPDHEGICPATLTGMAIDIAEGLAYLHRKNLIHRDIACRNCLVGSDGIVKIGDFGLTREMHSCESEGYYRFTRNCELPIRWMSPEAVQFGVFSVHSDIWSYGIVLYEIITFGVFPYDGLGDVEVVERVKRKDFSIIEFLPLAARDTTISRLIYQCCQHQWQHRPASLDHIIAILRKNPDCVRPFLTDEPPKPNSTIDALRFQPGAGACIMSKNTLASGDPSPSNPAVYNTTSDGTHGYPVSSGIRGVLSATGSLGGTGKSPSAHHSADSFSENLNTSAFLSFFSDVPLQNLGRRRHKTADSSTTACRYHGIRRGTSSSSCGHTFRSSDHSSGDRSTTEDQPHLTSEILTFPNWQKLDSFSPKSSVLFEEWKLKNCSKIRHGKPSPIRKIFSKQTSLGDEHMELVLPKNLTDFQCAQGLVNQSFVIPISYPQDGLKTRTSKADIVYGCDHSRTVQEDDSLAFGSW
ncbi:Insulin receptor-related protein [Schistosoma japonicum]|uniref:Insulin receptor-related protein n=1 Tax=Schistosoma japonicum TaxID=6182 RepID=A0A4Z2D576_SCHJA|nr:Insulin receptor-related protein [Schistosoma japonicum]TNN11643.1 Insulin receptor-related protein [Schistosoma japonicum]